MINVEVLGGQEVGIKLEQVPYKVHMALTREITISTLKLKDYIIKHKLSGQVLNHITGNLWRSIQQTVTSEKNLIIGRVFSSGDVKYAGIHEFGGSIKSRLGTGVGKPKPGGKSTIQMPERSFMRSSLSDMREEIIQRLSNAVKEGTS